MKDTLYAFPTIESNTDAYNTIAGMDLRDYFAAMAMQSIIPSLYTHDVTMDKEEIAKQAYWYADAMLRAR